MPRVGFASPPFKECSISVGPSASSKLAARRLRRKCDLNIAAAWCPQSGRAGTAGSRLKIPFSQLNAIFAAGDTTDRAAPSTHLQSQHHRALVSPAQTSKLAPGCGRHKQKSIFPPSGLKKTHANKMDTRKPWGLGMTTGRNKAPD